MRVLEGSAYRKYGKCANPKSSREDSSSTNNRIHYAADRSIPQPTKSSQRHYKENEYVRHWRLCRQIGTTPKTSITDVRRTVLEKVRAKLNVAPGLGEKVTALLVIKAIERERHQSRTKEQEDRKHIREESYVQHQRQYNNAILEKQAGRDKNKEVLNEPDHVKEALREHWQQINHVE